MKRKVCIVVQDYYPEDVRVRKEVKALRRRGHQVSVISLYRHGLQKHQNLDGVEIFRGGLCKRRSGLFRYILEYGFFFLFCLYKVNVLDVRKRFNVVEVCTLPDFLVFSTIIQKLKGRKIVLDMHEIMPEFFESKFGVGKSNPVVKVLLFLEGISLRFADEVITINEPIKRIFARRAIPNKRIEVVMNTVDGGSVSGIGKSAHDGFNCVYHGTITELYGLDMAIKGFTRALTHAGDMRFHIFGNGPEVGILKELARRLNVDGAVVFHGHLPYGEMLERLREMDLGILAFRKDVFLNLSFSNKLAEYIYFKIPVVTSDLDGVKFYFAEDQILYYEAGDAEDLGQKILYAYNNRKKVEAMSERAFERYGDLDWGVMAERYLKVVEEPKDARR
jgi:glycosyltransferase involved in cell wall biosynthesis